MRWAPPLRCASRSFGVVVRLVAVLAITLAGTPGFVAEVFLDAFLMGALYRKLRIAERENWFSSAIRETWKSAAIKCWQRWR